MDDYAGDIMNNFQLEQSSLGIKKILDVRIGEDGKQMYKVKWEPTWEPVENLVTCQHLIDEFWSFVNIAKVNENTTTKPAPMSNMNLHMNTAAKIPKIERITADDKSDVQRLIARTNQTSAGSPTLMSPNMLFNQQNQQNTHLAQQDQKPFSTNQPFQNNLSDSPSQKGKPPTTPKSEVGREKSSNNSTLRYVENFENPYVKIILVCKLCNKEQSLKFAHNWKTHYLSHVSNEEKPHKCDFCPKAFVTLPQKRKHMKTHENAPAKSNVKEEQMYPMY